MLRTLRTFFPYIAFVAWAASSFSWGAEVKESKHARGKSCVQSQQSLQRIFY